MPCRGCCEKLVDAEARIAEKDRRILQLKAQLEIAKRALKENPDQVSKDAMRRIEEIGTIRGR